MIPSVFSQQLQQGVEDFLKTTFPVSTPFFHGIVDHLLSEDEGVFKGPFLSIQLPFRYGDGRDDPFPNIKIDFTPYLHQEKAFAGCGGCNVHQQVNNFSIRQELQMKTERFRKGVKIFYRSKSNAATGC